MSKKTIHLTIPEDIVDQTESYMYETNARQALLAYCMEHGIDTDNPIFKRYHDEYVEFHCQYEMMKTKITMGFVAPKYPNAKWNLDFDTCTLTVEVGESAE